jgi:hypothetical protein
MSARVNKAMEVFVFFILLIAVADALDNGLALTPVNNHRRHSSLMHLLTLLTFFLNFSPEADGMDELAAVQVHN